MTDVSPEKQSGCGLLNAVFGRGCFQPSRRKSTRAAPAVNREDKFPKTSNSPNPKSKRGVNHETNRRSAASNGAVAAPESTSKPSSANQQRTDPIRHQNNQGPVNQGRKVPKETLGISGELESMIRDHQKSKGSSKLLRASSGNVMLNGNLGNLRQQGGVRADARNMHGNIPKTEKETDSCSEECTDGGAGYVARSPREDEPREEKPGSLCRALSMRMDPEKLKIRGNEDYKNGRFAEALALYDAAIRIDPKKASYRSSKSAALAALGHLLEAVFECREAINIDPRYHRAHHLLATLHLRLGDPEKAIYHFKHAGPEADGDDLASARTLQGHLNKCTEARRLHDWNLLIKESNNAISASADSAPQIYALQAEALLKVRRYQEAEEAMSKGPKLPFDACAKFFGPVSSANLLGIKAQVDVAAGRFDYALEAAERAVRLDSNNKEVSILARKIRAISAARSRGNELFKTSRFSEASLAYGEGLDHDPYNPVLLCNRAACLSKLGQFDRAIEDCTAALNVRPSYTKARLRRADCNAKLEKWEASVEDYEILVREAPGDDEVRRALVDARLQLKNQRGEEMEMENDDPDFTAVS